MQKLKPEKKRLGKRKEMKNTMCEKCLIYAVCITPMLANAPSSWFRVANWRNWGGIICTKKYITFIVHSLECTNEPSIFIRQIAQDYVQKNRFC